MKLPTNNELIKENQRLREMLDRVLRENTILCGVAEVVEMKRCEHGEKYCMPEWVRRDATKILDQKEITT